MTDDPIGFFLTWATYGTWLPGDGRGWVEYREGWKLPAPMLELASQARMTEDACRLSTDHRRAVESQMAETCDYRGWVLHAVNCRSNHVHVVVSGADTKPKKFRIDLKAWATRRLKGEFDANRENWWANRGSIRYVWNEEDLEQVVLYVADAQERMGQEQASQPDA